MSDDPTLDEFVESETSSNEEGFIETAAGKIPVDWSTTNVERVCELQNGEATDHVEIGAEPYLVYGSNGAIGSYTESNFEGGLIFGRVGAVGEIERVTEPVWVSDNAIQAQVSGDINAEYLYYCLTDKELSALATKTAQPLLNQSTIGNVTVPIPPLSEQRKIATVLHTVDQAIQKTEEIIEQVETIQMGIVQGLFETEPLVDEKDRVPSKGVQMESILDSRREKWIEAEKERQQRRGDFNGSIDESKYSQPLDVATRRLPELPDGWFWASLDTFVGYNIDYRGKTPPYSDSGVPVISSGNIQNGEIVFDDEKYVSRDTYDGWLDRGVPKEGDLLITTEAPVGKVALYPEGTYLPTRRIITLRTVGIENRYLKAAIRHPYIQNYLTAQSGGSTVGRILKDHLLRTPIPLPPKSKQRQISDTLKTVDNRLVTESAHKSHFSRLKQGLMQDLLSGEVRTTDTDIDIPEEIAQYG